MAQTWRRYGSYGGSSTGEQQIGSAVAASHTLQAKAWIANRTGAAKTCRLRHAPANAAADNAQYLLYDTSVAANDFIVSPTFILEPTDALYFTQSADGLAINVYVLDIA